MGRLGMSEDRNIDRYIRRLSKILRKMVLRSKEFEELCLLLEKGHFEMRLFLVPILFRSENKGSFKPHKGKHAPLRFELTEQDRKFLKKVGIRFDGS